MVEKKSSSMLGQVVLNIICILLVLICILPMLSVVASSLSAPEAILRNEVLLWPKEVNLGAYKLAIFGSSFLQSLGYTLLLTVVFTAAALLMTILCAYPLSKKDLKGGRIIMVFIVFSMYFDAGIIPRYLLVKEIGLLDTVAALILPGLLSAYNMIIMKNFFSSIDSSLLEAAKIDGCNEFQLLRQIVVPLSTAVIATLALFYAVSRWNGITDVIYYISNPAKRTLQSVLREIIKNQTFSNMEGGQSAGQAKTVTDSVRNASVVLSTLPILCVYPFVQKYFTKGIMLGAVKG